MKHPTTMHKHIGHIILISDSVCILQLKQEKAFEVKQSEIPLLYICAHITHSSRFDSWFKIVTIDPCSFSKQLRR
jgi:hypothetical protein